MPANDAVVADFDGDGNDDLAYAVDISNSANGSLSDLYVASGNGDGTFKAPVLVASEIGEFLAVGDTNGDNIPDVVSTTIQLAPINNANIGNSLFVLIGKGDGTFKSTATYVSDIPSDPHLADVNGDGKPDIIAGGSSGALVYLGNGDGTFQAYTEPAIGKFSLTYAVNAGDYNNDGNADLVGTDARNYQAAVSLSEVQQVADADALTSLAMFPLGSGTHDVDASYAGNSIYQGSISSTMPLRAAPTPTTLSLAVLPTSVTLAGQPVTLTATLNPYTVGPPTTTTDGESVQFFKGATSLGSRTLNGGVATITTTALPAGSETLQAVYPGDSNYNPSSSSSVSVTVASILLASSPNPSAYGQAVTFVATVPSGELGSVTFKDGGATLGTVPLSGSTASFVTSALAAGSHDITAVYSGDSSHSTAPATSPILTQVVNMATPSVTLSSSANPSTVNQSVTFTATVPATVSGTVTFSDAATALGTAAVINGVASFTTSTLSVGAHTVIASYSGDSNNNTAKSTPLTETVNKANPVLPAPSVSSTNTTVGSPETVSETVPQGVMGPVTFYDGSTPIGTAPIVNGVATITVSTLPVGIDPITASTPGDSNNNSATSPATVVTVTKTIPTITLTSSINPSSTGQSVTFTATAAAGATGPVVFLDGATTLGTTGLTSGHASFTTSSLTAGSHTITADYGGDSAYNANNPAPLT
jgi:Bacterial Ig-like domain (group 3)/FG-GAP-like repeat